MIPKDMSFVIKSSSFLQQNLMRYNFRILVNENPIYQPNRAFGHVYNLEFEIETGTYAEWDVKILNCVIGPQVDSAFNSLILHLNLESSLYQSSPLLGVRTKISKSKIRELDMLRSKDVDSNLYFL